MGKTIKRSRKFNAKGGTKALEKKGTSLTKKGKLVRRAGGSKGSRGQAGGDGGGGVGKKGPTAEESAEAKERASGDFLSKENLGGLDLESFFEKAVAEAEAEESGGDGDGSENVDGDDDSVDSYASLGSEEEDVAESEARMKRQLEELADKDPEFHTYLKENESSLLEFDAGDDDDEMMDDDEEGEEYVQDEDAMEEIAAELAGESGKGGNDDVGGGEDYPMQREFKRQQREAEDKFLLTPRRLEQLEQGAFASHSVKGLKRIISAFRTACQLSDANQQDQEQDGDDELAARRRKREFQITSPAVFDRLMAVCLSRCHEEFRYHLLEVGGQEGGEQGKGKGRGERSDDVSTDDEEEGNNGEANGAEKKQDPKKRGKDTPAKVELDENKPLHPKTLAKSPCYAAVRPLLESFLRCTLHLLSEAGKEARLLQFVLTALSKYVPFLTAFPKLSKPFLRACVQLWSAPLDTSEEYNAARLQAFLRVRQLAITQPYPFIEDALKLTYLAYARRARFGTASGLAGVLPTLTFMGNCIVELYALDYASAYQHTFVYIRQLALHLRTAMTKRTPEALRAVLCWQYVHCLKLWTAVLCTASGGKHGKGEGGEAGSDGPTKGAGKDEEAALMRSLVYPLTEIVLGTCRLAPVTRWVPLRLHCVRLLQQLAAKTEAFIPTTFLLMGILDLREVTMKPLRGGGRKGGKKGGKGSGGGTDVAGPRLALTLKLPKEGTLRSAEQVDAVLGETFVLLNREVDLYRYSPGFPEFSFTIVRRLRKFNKEVGNGRYRAYAKGTIDLCERHSAFAIAGRATLTEAPKDVRRLEALKPPGAPTMGERYDTAVAKERRLEAVSRPVMRDGPKTAVGKEGRDGGEEDDDNAGNDGEKRLKGMSKRKRKRKKAPVVNKEDLENVGALEEKDEVKEGVEWSDSE